MTTRSTGSLTIAITAALAAAAAVAPVVMPYFKNRAIPCHLLTVKFALSHSEQSVEDCDCDGAAAFASPSDHVWNWEFCDYFFGFRCADEADWNRYDQGWFDFARFDLVCQFEGCGWGVAD